MPEIRLGSSNNAKNINFGSKEIQEVRLGRTLVWINNLSPQIVLTSPPTGVYGDQNFDIGITIATNVNIVFSAQDPDVLDTIVSYAVDGPTGFTPVPTTPITPGNPVSGLTFTIPNTLFTNPGEPTTNNVFTITVTDQRGKEGIYTVTVANVSIEPPVVTVYAGYPSNLKYLNPTVVTRTATFRITQSPAAIAAGYTAQYSLDGTNWVNGTSVNITKSTTCGKSATASVYGRSVKTGEATAYGNNAFSTLRVTAPQAYFPLTGGGGCVYRDYYTGTSGGNVIRGFYHPQSCDAVISGAGSTISNKDITFTSDNIFFASQSNVIFTGTAFQDLVVDGNSTSINLAQKSRVRYDVTYTVPSVSGTGIPFTCSGGDVRRTAFYLGIVNTVSSISGDLGTTGVGSLLNRGQDYIYTSVTINSPHVSINVNGNGFGDTTYAASFNQVGVTSTKPIYTGYYRLASGGQENLSGPNRYTRTFRTNEP